MARRRRPPQPPVEDNRAGLDPRSGTLDSRMVRRSRKPWIGVLVATCTMAPIPVAGAVTDQAPTPLPPPVAGKTVNAAVRAGKVRFRLPGAERLRRPHRSAAAPDRDDLRHHRGARDADLGQRHQGRDPARVVLRGHLHARPDDGPQPITTLALAGALPSCPKARRARRGDAQAQVAPPVGRRQGPLPHQRALQLGDGARHALGRLRPLRRDADPRRARLGHGPRPRAQQDRRHPRGRAVPGAPAAERTP